MPPTLHLKTPATPDAGSARPDQVSELVLRLVGGERSVFLARRASLAVHALPDGAERRHLGRLLALTHDGCDPCDRTEALLAWAGHLESRGLLEWADSVLEQARQLSPKDPVLFLHAARLARKQGRIARARRCYDRVAELDDGSGSLSRMAIVGYALLVNDKGRALGRVMRAMLRVGDPEAAAVAQEARAALRRARGDVDGALRDYGAAAARFEDPIDRGRIGHEVADLLSERGDPLAARRVLIATERISHPVQVERARSRLLAIARAVDDQIGIRRWSDAPSSTLVSLVTRTTMEPGSGRAGRVEGMIRRYSGTTTL